MLQISTNLAKIPSKNPFLNSTVKRFTALHISLQQIAPYRKQTRANNPTLTDVRCRGVASELAINKQQSCCEPSYPNGGAWARARTSCEMNGTSNKTCSFPGKQQGRQNNFGLIFLVVINPGSGRIVAFINLF